MAAGTRIHGKQGLIYLSGSEVEEATLVTINHVTDSEEGPVFGDTYPPRAVGLMHWSGSITTWAIATAKDLQAAAQAGFSVALLAYADRRDMTDYYSGSIILSFEHNIEVTALQGVTGPFDGDGNLVMTGFS